jgi:hypothetical protein
VRCCGLGFDIHGNKQLAPVHHDIRRMEDETNGPDNGMLAACAPRRESIGEGTDATSGPGTGHHGDERRGQTDGLGLSFYSRETQPWQERILRRLTPTKQ